MVLEIPQSESESIKLNLYKTNVYNPDANVITASDGSITTPGQGQHYWGVVQGDFEHSLAAISISENEISGLVQMGNRQYVLGKMENSDQEIFYPSDKLPSGPDFKMDELEVEYDIYQHFGNVADTQAYIEAAWSQVFILYKNEGIDMAIKTLKIWDTDDPYWLPDTCGNSRFLSSILLVNLMVIQLT